MSDLFAEPVSRRPPSQITEESSEIESVVVFVEFELLRYVFFALTVPLKCSNESTCDWSGAAPVSVRLEPKSTVMFAFL